MRETKLYYYVLVINTILTIHRVLKKTTLIRFLQHKIQRVPGNPTIDWDHVLTLEGCFVSYYCCMHTTKKAMKIHKKH